MASSFAAQESRDQFLRYKSRELGSGITEAKK